MDYRKRYKGGMQADITRAERRETFRKLIDVGEKPAKAATMVGLHETSGYRLAKLMPRYSLTHPSKVKAAAKAVADCLASADEKTRLAAAKMVYDRVEPIQVAAPTLAQAAQYIQINVSSIGDAMAMLDVKAIESKG